MKELIVNPKYHHKKLNIFILNTFPALSPNTLYKALRKKDIRINDKRIHENVTLHTGDKITLFIADDLLFPPPLHLPIIYEDEQILIINKPTGISVTENVHSEITLTDLVKKQLGKNIEPCHRLDYHTTGLILYAKNKTSLAILQQKFKNREIEKHYKTTVLGTFSKKHAILTAYLFKDSKKSLVYISDSPQKNYAKIITEYTVIYENQKNNTSELDVILHTGKTHQIRAHLSFIGHPIIGDGKYGNYEINKQFGQSTQMLCSCKLKFNFTTESGILSYLNRSGIFAFFQRMHTWSFNQMTISFITTAMARTIPSFGNFIPSQFTS